jgi:AcrR family transcriptional regulator
MSGSVNSRRSYDASGRREAARHRRERVLRAAADHFLRSGYAATTVAAVAAWAEVSPETVYKTFGGKAGLVLALRDRALEGAGPVPAETRSDDLRGLDDPRRIVAGWASLAAEVAPRVVPVLLLVRDAAAGDPTLRALHDEMEAARLARMDDNARSLADAGHLRADVDRATAADVMYAVSAPEMFELLVLRRGWSVARYASYVESTLVAALLPGRP